MRTVRIRINATGQVVWADDYGPKVYPRYWTQGDSRRGFTANEVDVLAPLQTEPSVGTPPAENEHEEHPPHPLRPRRTS